MKNDDNYMYDDDLIEIKSEDEQFNMYFCEYYALFIKRIERMKELDNDTDRRTYLDMLFISIRALLIEQEKNKSNYTLQNFLRRNGQDALICKINDYLNTRINSMYTLREVIKIITDKFIAHHDSLQVSEQEIADDKPKEQMNTDKILIAKEVFTRNLFLMDIARTDFPYSVENIACFIQGIVDEAKASLPQNSNI